MNKSILTLSVLSATLLLTACPPAIAGHNRFSPASKSVTTGPNIIYFTVLPRRVKGGATVGGAVELDVAAGPGGELVTITYTGPITGPSSFVIPEGATRGSFYATTSTVKKTTEGSMTVTLNNGSSWIGYVTIEK